ncbi:phosphate ABC transporter substrate-binding protein [Neptunicella sp. SCSIO 80796]|uniref:phosphate ABC transporter substrate-binding protein n=1 Tax=Neptunicella plasticusilytica TaxID=3117012 RepID=UPI003A4DA314
MKKLFSMIALVSSALFSSFSNADIAVIVNPANSATISQDDVVKLFLGKAKSFSNGDTAVPVNQENGAVDEFNSKVLNKSGSQIKAYWSKLVFTGKGTPPKEVDGDDEVKKLVADNPNIIGYIDASKADGSVKVVLTL